MTFYALLFASGTSANTADLLAPVTASGGGVLQYDAAIYDAGGAGATLTNSGIVVNNGARNSGIGITGIGIYFNQAGGTLINDATGVISGYKWSVFGASTVVNTGTISGGKANAIANATLVRNGAVSATSALIGGDMYGIATVNNFGTILGSVRWVGDGGMTNGSSLSGIALIRGSTTELAAVSSGHDIVNYGTIEGTNTAFGGLYVAVRGYDGATITNMAGGIICGATGIGTGPAFPNIRPNRVVNQGTVFGTLSTGLRFTGVGNPATDGSIVNGATDNAAATISGAVYGTFTQNNVTTTNYGVIVGTGTSGIGIVAGGPGNSVTNAAGGLISGVRYGFSQSLGPGVLINAGTISATGTAGTAIDVFINGHSVTSSITNSGTVSATGGDGAIGVRLQGSLANLAGGVVEGTARGIVSLGATVTNAGTIRGTGTAGIGVQSHYLSGVANLAGGTISGPSTGVLFSGDIGGMRSLTNYGLITGALGVNNVSSSMALITGGTITGTDGTALTSTGGLYLTLQPGYHFGGTVIASTAGNVEASLLLGSAAATGTIAGIGSEFQHFKYLGIDTGARWAMTGTNTLASTYNNIHGTLALAGDLLGANYLSLFSAGEIIGHGTLGGRITPIGSIVASGGTLVLAGHVLVGEPVHIATGASAELTANFFNTYLKFDGMRFDGPSATLILDTPASFASTITNPAQSDCIDLKGVTATSAPIIGTTLTVHRSGGADLVYTLANSTLVNPIALIAPDGSGGSMLTFAGDDSYIVNAPTDIITEGVGWGTDSVTASINYTLPANVENLTLVGAAKRGWGNDLANSITGNGLANDLRGANGNDTLSGGAGDDSLNGGIGNDSLIGGIGYDTLTGGPGNDRFAIDAGADSIADLGLGADTLLVSSGATVTASIAAPWTATAATSNNGAATILAAGFDVTLAAATGTIGWTLTNAGNPTAVKLAGSKLADVLTGGSGNDTISAGTGADALAGGIGNDSLDGGAGNDTINGGPGSDTLTGGTGADHFILAIGEAAGDTITDFLPGTDRLDLTGFGKPSGGASFVKLTTTDWRIAPAAGGTPEVIHFTNAPAITAIDVHFI